MESRNNQRNSDDTPSLSGVQTLSCGLLSTFSSQAPAATPGPHQGGVAGATSDGHVVCRAPTEGQPGPSHPTWPSLALLPHHPACLIQAPRHPPALPDQPPRAFVCDQPCHSLSPAAGELPVPGSTSASRYSASATWYLAAATSCSSGSRLLRSRIRESAFLQKLR